MSRLAMDQITITDVTDGEKGVSVKIVTPLYTLGTATPDKPTVNPPESIWTTTEPEYIKGKNLYTTQRTVLEDSTFSYSDVSLDSSYKASEQAITKADTANTTAGEAKTTAGEAKTTSTEAKTTSTEAKTIATEAKTSSTTNKDNLASEIQARNEAITNLKTSVDEDIEVVRQKAADAQEAGDTASADLSTFRTSTDSQLTSINGLVGGVRTDVDAVSKKATTLASGLDSANTKITDTSDKLTGLTTTVGNISNTADDAMALSTTNHQDLAGFQTTVQQTYSTKQETLSQVSAVSQKADSISATLSKDYQKKTDSDATYATKTTLQATASDITASVSETYATKSVVEALQNIADNAIETWQGHGIPSMTGKPTSDWITSELKKQHSGDMYYDLDTGYSYRFGSADGSTYKWDKISDSDITRAMKAAADAQVTADKNTAAVTKLNTDIPLTYASKSEVKVTTDGIKADVVEAKRIGQTGVDNAAALDIRADGIDATLSQQTTNIDNNVKAISQVNMRADSLSTSITQVNMKTDLALANAQELVINGGFETGDLTGWTARDATGIGVTEVANETHSGKYMLSGNLPTSPNAIEFLSQTFPVVPGRILRCSGWFWNDARAAVANISINFSDSSLSGKTDINSLGDGWKYVSVDVTVPSGVSSGRFRLAYYHPDSNTVFTRSDDLSVKDITEAKAAQSAADSAQSTANTAVSQVSTLSQDLSGFKMSVGQTYETKTDSSAKATTAQQNLDGFKTSVSTTYATKSALDSTNGNVSNAQNSASQALANAEEKLKNPTFKNGFDGWGGQWRMSDSPIVDHWGVSRLLPVCDQAGGGYGNKFMQSYTNVPVNPGQVWQLQAWAKVLTEQSGKGLALQLKWYDASGNQHWTWVKSLDMSAKTDWTLLSATVAIPSTAISATLWLHVSIQANDAVQVLVDSCSLKDITEVAELKSDVAATYATQSSVQQTSSQIKSDVANIYATKDTVSQVSSTVTQNATEWGVNLETVNSRIDGVDTATSDLSDQITNVNTSIQDVNDALSGEIDSRKSYIRFSQDENGKPLLELGDSASKVKAQLRNDRLSFVSNGVEVAYVSDNQLYINNAKINNMLQMGNFMWAPRPDGHLILSKI